MKKYLFLATTALSLALPVSALASELFGKISYKGQPLKNAEITIQDKKTKTNDIGYYSVNLDPGEHVLVIKLPDGSSRQEKINLFPQDTEKNFKLE